MNDDSAPTTCRWCGKTYVQHRDERGLVTPRVPCVGLKRNFTVETTAMRTVPMNEDPT